MRKNQTGFIPHITSKKLCVGFTLIELLLYVGITAIIAGSMFGIFNTVTKTGLQQSASNEASTQLNFVMQTVQNLVKSSSLIETETLTGVATSTLKLRMENPSKDPTCISLVGGAIKLAEGPDESNKQNCTSTLSNLTDNNVVVDQLDFKKFSQYPGHDVVSLNIQITSSSTNPTSRVTRNLQASIARVSAATFDSDLIPGSDNTWSVGFSPTRWKDAAFSGNLFVEGNVGIGTTTAATLFSVATSTNIFNVTSAGNVGIGTTAPGAKLDIVGGFLHVGAAAYPSAYPYPSSTYVILDKTSTADDVSLVLRDQGNARAEIGLVSDNEIHFKTVTGTYPNETFTDRMLIKPTGEVWVMDKLGVSTIPVEKFHIADNYAASRLLIKIENTNTGGGSRATGIQLKASNINWSIGTDIGLNGGNDFAIQDNNFGYMPRFFIDSSGNVGIGTDTPGSRLTIADGDVYIATSTRGIILRRPDGGCARGTIDNSNVLSFATITCP